MKSPWISLLLLCALPAPGRTAPPAPLRHEATRLSMGCAYAIVAHGADPRALAAAAESALDEVDRIDRLMSHYKPESPLSRLNREAAGGPVAVEVELFDFIAASLRWSVESEGAFDITVSPLMKAWGFFRAEGRVPADEELARARTRVGHHLVLLDHARRTVRFARPGVELDLGGIAKGYAVDRAVEVLRRAGVASALVSACGSTTYGLGAPPGAEAWEVEVQDPLGGPAAALTVRLRDRALSVSGSAEKFFVKDGVRYAHVMDPRTGRPVSGVLGVAVLAPTGTDGDALDNAVFVQGVARGRALIRRRPGTEAFVFVPGGRRGWRGVRLAPGGPKGAAGSDPAPDLHASDAGRRAWGTLPRRRLLPSPSRPKSQRQPADASRSFA